LRVRVKKEATSQDKNFFKNKRFLTGILNHPFTRKVDKYLKEAGYPYGITSEIYILMHIITIIIALFLFYQNKKPGQFVGFTLLVSIGLNVIIYLQGKKRREIIQVELCNIQDIFYFQSKIGTPQDIIFAYAAKAAREPLKTPLQALAEKYKLNKDLGKALEEFRQTTGMMEFQAFTFILEQKERNGFSEENHHAQATMLKRAKRMRRRIQRAYKRGKLIIAAILLFACYMLFAAVPLLKNVFQNIDLILR
jgi:Flp pilus assembly protein TadB